MTTLKFTLSITILISLLGAFHALPASGPIPVKVAVIVMSEVGETTGDAPGEYQFWIEREKLNKIYSFPFGPHDLRMNDAGVMGVCTAPYPAKGLTAKEVCYRVAAPVVHALVDGWDKYKDSIPGGQ